LQGAARSVGAQGGAAFNIGITGAYIRFKLGIQITRQNHNLFLHDFSPDKYTVALVGADKSYHSLPALSLHQIKPNVNNHHRTTTDVHTTTKTKPNAL
jgi:hypothetical protein